MSTLGNCLLFLFVSVFLTGSEIIGVDILVWMFITSQFQLNKLEESCVFYKTSEIRVLIKLNRTLSGNHAPWTGSGDYVLCSAHRWMHNGNIGE